MDARSAAELVLEPVRVAVVGLGYWGRTSCGT